MTPSSTIHVGKILMSQPFLLDPNFRRTVIILCDHSSEGGTVGFVMNRCLDMPMHKLVLDFPESDIPVFFGGPVGTDTIHYVHRKGALLPDSVLVSSGVFWGGDFEALKEHIRTGMITPEDIRFFVGYSGWSPGQLDMEYEQGTWVCGNMDSKYIFGQDYNSLWRKSLEDLGSQYSVIAQIPEFISLN